MQKNILIIGYGDIAKRLCSKLNDDVYKVYGVSRNNTYDAENFISWDWLSDELPKLESSDYECVVFMPKPKSFDKDGYIEGFIKSPNNIFNLLFLALFFLVLIVQIFMPAFVSMIAPGFVDNFDKMNLAIYLTRITFPFLLFICIASFFAAILNSHNKFAVASAAPIILNIVLIGILIFGKYLDDELIYDGLTIMGDLSKKKCVFYV